MDDFTLVDDRRPVPPAASPLLQVPGLGTLPLPHNTLLHETEARDLRPFNWKQGDPVPPDFAERLAHARRLIAEDVHSGKLKGVEVPAFQSPKEIKIEDMPESYRQDLAGYLRQYKEMEPAMRQAREGQSMLASLPPSVQQAIRTAMGEDGVIELVDSSRDKPVSQPAVVHGTTVPVPATSSAPPAATLQKCPHCTADLSGPLPDEPTKVDAMNYVVSVLGGQRFVKEYDFLGGRLQVSLRAPMTVDMSRAAEQLSLDQAAGRIRSFDDMCRLGFDYRLAISLDTVTTAAQRIQVGRAVDEYLAQPAKAALEGGQTQLPELLAKLKSKSPLSNASVWGMLLDAATNFHELLVVLQRRGREPSFWKAIEA